MMKELKQISQKVTIIDDNLISLRSDVNGVLKPVTVPLGCQLTYTAEHGIYPLIYGLYQIPLGSLTTLDEANYCINRCYDFCQGQLERETPVAKTILQDIFRILLPRVSNSEVKEALCTELVDIEHSKTQ
jgi:hypothetical protein